MNRISISLILFTYLLFTTNCEKDRLIFIKTGTVIDSSYTYVKIKGKIIDPGEGISDYGHVLSIFPNPIIGTELIATTFGNINTVDTFTSLMEGLDPGEIYHVRAYAKNGNIIKYGKNLAISTMLVVPPTLSTLSVTKIDANSVETGGTITDRGGAAVYARGVCWATHEFPTTNDYATFDGTGIGTFKSLIGGLSPTDYYWVRAYATNKAGTDYGQGIYFSTK